MKKISFLIPLVTVVILGFYACNNSTKDQGGQAKDYPIKPVIFTDVKLNDDFWLHRIIRNTEVTIPIAFKHSESTDRINNFAVAGGLVEGEHIGKRYNDSDVFKIMEGAAYSLSVYPDKKLEQYLDSLISLIGAAQEEDGYLYTARTINPEKVPEYSGEKRWSFLEQSHELYNVGHMYEAAVAHYLVTDKRTFLDIAIKNANLIDKEFGWGKIEMYPGHQEIEIGLVKLFRVTGDQRYLDLAKFFLDVRGPDDWEYNQAHLKVVDQMEPVGHAVRALYMYSGMADVTALTGDQAYLPSLNTIWENIVSRKIYVTGGIGQTGGNEGFGPDYELPNMTAYCETCASIANVFWNQRMFLLSGDAKYIDVMERTMYNALLSGVSLSGDRFFYDNPLESKGDHERQEWFGCACCPSNVSRFLPSLPGYIYAHKEDQVYINLFIDGETSFETSKGKMAITQKSNYPWEGNITIHIYPEHSDQYEFLIRIPGWAQNNAIAGDLYTFSEEISDTVIIKINDERIEYSIDKGYAVLNRKWEAYDKIEVILPFDIRKVLANEKVEDDKGRFVLQRGPLVYCLEGNQSKGIEVRHVISDIDQQFNYTFNPDLLDGIGIIDMDASTIKSALDGSQTIDGNVKKLKTIPYAFWANRGPGQMLVWIPYKKEFTTPE